MSEPKRPHVLFFIPEDWYLCSHRLPLLRGARAMGCDVTAATRVRDHAQPILETGAVLEPLQLRRGYRGLVHEVSGLRQLIGVYRRVRPDLVHHVTPKSVIYGSIAARFAGVPCVVNAMAGLGFVYTSRAFAARLLSPVFTLALRLLLRRHGARLIVQNDDDLAFFRDHIRVPEESIVLIRGAGVDVELFSPADTEPPGPLRAVLVARMLSDKGIRETIAAARLLKERGRDDIRIVLAGRVDTENPAGIPRNELAAWHAEGIVEVLGHIDDVPGLLRSCHMALLPSYREGLPKSLLEAAACGLPIVAADVTGCREICLDGVNGLLVPPRTSAPIADALVALADDPDRRLRFGRESRRLAVDDFAERIVTERTMAVYRELLKDRP